MIDVITKFISGLSDLGKKLLIVTIIVVIVALFDRLLIAPTVSHIASIDTDIAKEESSIKQDLHFLSYEDKINKEDKAVSRYFTDKLPSEDEIIAAFLKKIEILAGKANVVLAKVTPASGQEEKNDIKYSADLECSGKFVDIVTFMHLINSSDELTKVAKFNLSSKKADTDEIKATMTVAKIIISKKPLVKPANPTTSNTQADASTTKNM